jgi:ATP-dependent DNA ligase
VDGISDFNALHSANNDEVQLYAFILAVNGDDLRSLPLSMRKALIWNGCWRAGRLASF